MKKCIVITTTFICSLFSTLSYSFFCPNNFSQINFGDAIGTVDQKCGLPANKSKKPMTATPSNQPQEWTYFLPQQSNTTYYVNSNTGTPGTLKTQFAFNGTGTVINISINGQGVGETSACGSTIAVGDSRDSVASSCGKPTLIAEQGLDPKASDMAKEDSDANKHIEYFYSTTPPVTLIFEGGKLVGKQ